MRWSPQEVAAWAGGTVWMPPATGTPRPPDQMTLTEVSIDSRLLSPGALFVALRASRDGHEWIASAIAAGAGGLLVDGAWDRSSSGDSIAVPIITAENTAEALLGLGRRARTRLAARVIGVTGSVGKTSTKDLTAAALAVGLRTTASEKSFNNELGVPLTLANAPEDTEAAVIEMGARGPGHIARLCQVAQPDIGIVTAVAAAHTEAFGDLDAVATAKAELVAALPAAGTAILNFDDPRVRAMAPASAAAVISYSAGGTGPARADVFAERVALDDQLRPSFVVRSPWGAAPVRLEARGVHQVGNALAALSVAACCGVPLDEAAAGLADAHLSPWRMELGYTPAGAAVLNDAYNANPASVAAALRALVSLPARRRVAVLGEMAELGARSRQEHAAMGALAEQLGVEVLSFGSAGYGARTASGIDEALAAIGCLGPDDAVLVKASRVVGLERLAARLLAG
jgi:UDP-N-acetylmuramoyl-tripeptide--D-alanyl-D-alanine ligase